MINIELRKEGENGLKKAFIRGEKFYHNSGKILKLFPFDGRTKSDVFNNELRSFHGVVGESFRICSGKKIDKAFSSDKESSYNTKLKAYVIDQAINSVRTENRDELKDAIVNLFFGDNNELIKFNGQVLSYMNFTKEHNALSEMAFFMTEVFLDSADVKYAIDQNQSKDNLFYQLIVDCLPKHFDHDYKAKGSYYYQAISEIGALFKNDFDLLVKDDRAFLDEIEKLFKFYYFFYMIQLSKRLSSFGKVKEIQPVFFTMDWESLSGSRLSYQFGWNLLLKDMQSLFAHANTIELLNYIEIDGEKVGDYNALSNFVSNADPETNQVIFDKIKDIISFYEDSNAGDIEKIGLERLNKLLENQFKPADSELVLLLKRLYYTILFVLDHTSRNKVKRQYSEWLIQFCKVNYTKVRGRLGVTNSLTQEVLLFLVKLCVGHESKIRLNTLWHQLEVRGIKFDEASKAEIVKLFERINLLEIGRAHV